MAEIPIPPGGMIGDSSAISSTRGTSITANGSANTKGSWTQVIASTAIGASAILVTVQGQQATATQATQLLVDIGIGASSSEVVLIPNLSVCISAYATYCSVGVAHYLFPIAIPAGSRLSARYQGVRTDNNCYVRIDLLGNGTGRLDGSGTVEAWGPDTSTSKLIELDPGGTANTKGSYTQLIASTARRTRELVLAFANPDNDSTGASQVTKVWSIDVAVGAAGSEVIIVPDIQVVRAWSICFAPQTLHLPISIPAGTRVAARCCCTVNTSSPSTQVRKVSIAAYGVS